MNQQTILGRLRRQPLGVVAVGVLLGFGFLLLDAFVDVFFFSEEGEGFLHGLLEPDPMDLWMRAVVFVLVIGFSIYASWLLQRQAMLADDLKRERDGLAQRVQEATEDMRLQNLALREEIERRSRLESELRELAITDPLTELFNRRKLLEDLKVGIVTDHRYHTGLALILCDIDHFKSINDQHGHDVGDAVLREFAKCLRLHTREADIVARWGGEEFAILMAIRDGPAARAVADKLRQFLATSSFAGDLVVSASFGVAVLTDRDSAETFVKRADQALYAAKGAGRNTVVLASD